MFLQVVNIITVIFFFNAFSGSVVKVSKEASLFVGAILFGIDYQLLARRGRWKAIMTEFENKLVSAWLPIVFWTYIIATIGLFLVVSFYL